MNAAMSKATSLRVPRKLNGMAGVKAAGPDRDRRTAKPHRKHRRARRRGEMQRHLPGVDRAPGANESLPINCITWYEAFAFCAWDGGFLPTEAEWNYAAAGGSEQRAYPWSNPPTSTTIDCSHANYDDCAALREPAGDGAVNRVGSESPAGRRQVGPRRPRRQRLGVDARLVRGAVPAIRATTVRT